MDDVLTDSVCYECGSPPRSLFGMRHFSRSSVPNAAQTMAFVSHHRPSDKPGQRALDIKSTRLVDLVQCAKLNS